MNQLWLLAFQNLKRNIKRNFATGSAIAFGFAGILMLIGYVNRVQNFIKVQTVYSAHTGHLALFIKDGFEKMPFKPQKYSFSIDEQKIINPILSSESNVDFFEQQLQSAGMAGNGCVSMPFFALGIEPNIDQKIREHSEVKKWAPQTVQFIKGNGLWFYKNELSPIIMSKSLANALGKTSIYDEVKNNKVNIVPCESPDAKNLFSNDSNIQLLAGSWQGNMNAIDGELVALNSTGFTETEKSALLMPLSQLQKLLETSSISRYSIWLKNPNHSQTAAQLIKKISDAGIQAEIVEWHEEKISPYYAGTMQFLYTLAVFISIVLSTIIMFSMLNSVTITVLERTQEIGMYRAFGFNQIQVRSLFLKESLFLSFISLCFGAILAFLCMKLINYSNITYYPPGVSDGLQLLLIPNFNYSLLIGIILLLLTLFSTIFAISKTLHKKIADLLGGTNR